jgi:hypothetical protein
MHANEASAATRSARTVRLVRAAMVAAMTFGPTACSAIDFGDTHVANLPKPDGALTAPPANLKNGGEP